LAAAAFFPEQESVIFGFVKQNLYSQKRNAFWYECLVYMQPKIHATFSLHRVYIPCGSLSSAGS